MKTDSKDPPIEFYCAFFGTNFKPEVQLEVAYFTPWQRAKTNSKKHVFSTFQAKIRFQKKKFPLEKFYLEKFQKISKKIFFFFFSEFYFFFNRFQRKNFFEHFRVGT